MRPRQERTGPPSTERPARSGTATSTTESLPQEGDPRRIGELLGETLVRLHCLELEVAEIRRGARR